jgi:CubicO group peptidase (beta-lactamase class C family)
VLQQLLEESQRTNFAALVKREVFLPLGMSQSTFENLLPGKTEWELAAGHRTNVTVAAKWRLHPEQAPAGLWATASDLARLLTALYQAHDGAQETFLRRSSVHELWSSQWKNSALGFFLNSSGRYRRINHDGANVGYRCQMVLYPELGCGAVILTNADEGNDLVQELLASIAEEYGWPEYAP